MAGRRWLPTLVLLLFAPAVVAEPPARTDAQGDPLPPGALYRLGTTRFRDGGRANAIAVAPDGKSLAVVGGQAIRILDLNTGKELRSLKSNGLPAANHAVYSPDGRLIAASDFTGRIQLWDAATGEAAGQVMPAGPDRIGGRAGTFSFSADGKYLALASENIAGTGKGHAAVYEVATGKQTASVETLHNYNVGAALSGDGKVLVTTGHYLPRGAPEPPGKGIEISETVEVWDAATGKELHKLRCEGSAKGYNAAFSPDGKHLAVVSVGGGAVIWDLATGKQVRTLAGRRNLLAFVGYSPDGKTLAAASQDGTVQTWDPASGKRLGLYEAARAGGAPRFAYTKSGRLLAVSTTGQAVTVWDVAAEKWLTPADGHQAAVMAVAFAADGKGVTSASADGAVISWDAAGKEARRVQLRGDGVAFTGAIHLTTLLLSPDRKHALGSLTNSLALFELARGREVCAFPSGFAGFGTATAFSADGGRVAVAQSDLRTRKPVVRLLDVATGQELRKFEGLAADPRGVALAPDGKVVAAVVSGFQPPAGQVNEVRAWDAATGKELWHAAGLTAPPQGLAFSPDGKALAAVDPSGGVTLYDAAGGQERRRVAGQPGASGTSPPTFSPDGRLLAFAAYDANARATTVRVLEVAAGTVRHEFAGHDGVAQALAFSPDGKRLASGGNDTTVLVWDLTGGSDGEVAKGKPTAEELDKLWAALGDGDARAAHKAMRRLAAAPGEAVALVTKHVRPDDGKGAGDEVARLIAALDDDSFDVRQDAHKQLAAMGKSVEEPLRKALGAGPSAEMKRAVEDLLDKLKDKGQGPPPESLRALRAVEVLEDLGTPEARKLLEQIAKGRQGAPLTAAAEDAVGRLRRAAKP